MTTHLVRVADIVDPHSRGYARSLRPGPDEELAIAEVDLLLPGSAGQIGLQEGVRDVVRLAGQMRAGRVDGLEASRRCFAVTSRGQRWASDRQRLLDPGQIQGRVDQGQLEAIGQAEGRGGGWFRTSAGSNGARGVSQRVRSSFIAIWKRIGQGMRRRKVLRVRVRRRRVLQQRAAGQEEESRLASPASLFKKGSNGSNRGSRFPAQPTRSHQPVPSGLDLSIASREPRPPAGMPSLALHRQTVVNLARQTLLLHLSDRVEVKRTRILSCATSGRGKRERVQELHPGPALLRRPREDVQSKAWRPSSAASIRWATGRAIGGRGHRAKG